VNADNVIPRIMLASLQTQDSTPVWLDPWFV